MNTMLDLAVLVLLGCGTSLETQPARAATGTVEDLRQFEKKLQEAVRRVAPAVVGVGLSARDGTEQYRTERGSGVVIDESGLVLTHGPACGVTLASVSTSTHAASAETTFDGIPTARSIAVNRT